MSDEERFTRLELLVGAAGRERLTRASVAVFGLGGVGSFAVEALVRGGVGHLTLVDFDTVARSNFNRQLHALEETVGRPKAQVMAERCRSINPDAEIRVVQEFYGPENAAALLAPGYDFVLDCIDNITAKLHLIQTCVERRLPIVVSMGAANKIDPTRVALADLSQTRICRLARVLRKELRRRGIDGGVPVVYSSEEFRPLSSSGGGRAPRGSGAEEYQQRRVPLGSSSVVPPLFGLMMAGEVLRRLLGEGETT